VVKVAAAIEHAARRAVRKRPPSSSSSKAALKGMKPTLTHATCPMLTAEII